MPDPVVAARSVLLLVRRGMVQLTRPDQALRALLVARRAGPIVAAVRQSARRRPDAIALVDDRRSLTFAEVQRRSEAAGAGLARAGVEPGQSVGLLCHDRCELIVALAAAATLGARAVVLNPGLARRQVTQLVAREDVRALVVDDDLVDLVGDVPGDVPRFAVGGGAASFLAMEEGPTGGRVRLPASPGGMVLLTSGTTGLPRGAARGRISPLQSAQLLDRVPVRRGGAVVVAAPLFHGTGLGWTILALALGKTVVLRGARFDPRRCLEDIAAHRAESLVLVPTMLHRIVEVLEAEADAPDTSSLAIVSCGGSPLSSALLARARRALGDVVYNVYGSTEVANVSVATPDELRRAPGTVGRPPLGCRVELLDDDRAPIRVPDRPGEIFASSGTDLDAYTDGTRRERVGRLVGTGDIGRYDTEGLLFVVGRSDEMIVSGGENVYPVEIESALVEHPAVADAAVIGVPDADLGQRLVGFVALRPGAAASAPELLEHLRSRLERSKVPRELTIVDELPRNAGGKLVRSALVGAGPDTRTHEDSSPG